MEYVKIFALLTGIATMFYLISISGVRQRYYDKKTVDGIIIILSIIISIFATMLIK